MLVVGHATAMDARDGADMWGRDGNPFPGWKPRVNPAMR